MFTIWLSLFCGNQGLQAAVSPPSQPITAPLHAVPGSQTISEEFLINLENDFCSGPFSSINWLDNNTLIYELNGKIEFFDINNGLRTCLGKGSHPKVSPNSQWIAFISDNNDSQIWLMRKDGLERRQLTNLKDGLAGAHDYHYNFAWSSDSNQLALYINPVEPIGNPLVLNLPSSQINVIDVMTGTMRKVYSDFALIGNLSWYPSNEKKLLMTKLRIGFFYHEDEHTSYVQSVGLSDGHVTILAKFNGLQQCLCPELSPDGLKISLHYNVESDLIQSMPKYRARGKSGNRRCNPAA